MKNLLFLMFLSVFVVSQVFAGISDEQNSVGSPNQDEATIETATGVDISSVMDISNTSIKLQPRTVAGTVTDEDGQPLPGVYVLVQGTTVGTMTGVDGTYQLQVGEPDAVLEYSFVGMVTQQVPVGSQTEINVTMQTEAAQLQDIVVVGYGTQRKESLTGAISGVESTKLEPIKAATTSVLFAGQVPGVTYRQRDGRPGATAEIQIRNYGEPLIIVDGFERDMAHFNNIAPEDIESISVLKDASAAIYGVRAGNGVIIVTTKRGRENTRSKINVRAYNGWSNFMRFPDMVWDSYTYMLGVVHAQMNATNPSTSITQAELDKYKAGTEYGYDSFNWKDFVIARNSPTRSININLSGGSDMITHYISFSHIDETAVLGDEFKTLRTNLQTNFDIKITDRITVGGQIHGRIDGFDQPGVPGGDDYQNPLQILYRNKPTERAYANDNPKYINNIGHNEQQWALFTKEISGYSWETHRVMNPNFTFDYDIPVNGLTFRASYSYSFKDLLMNEHEYTYDVYTYRPLTDEYDLTFANRNPWRRRVQERTVENTVQARLNFDRSFGNHTINATAAMERLQTQRRWDRYNSYPQTNVLPLIYFDDLINFYDEDEQTARIGYISRVNYSFGRKYYLELVGRYDGSWKFPEDKRWGFFPSFSAGWRITEESFMPAFVDNLGLDLKLRGSYGMVGNDNVGIGAFDYLTGYTFGVNTQILNGVAMKGSRDRGVPITNITWYTSKILNIGADFGLFQNRINGTFDVFRRERDGLLGTKYDILVPVEIGYTLPQENVNSDGVRGVDASLEYNGRAGGFTYRIGVNGTLSRNRDLETYKPRFENSWDEYTSSTEDRWSGTRWGYESIGQFQSMEEINNYPVDIDGRGNESLLPGDLIYKDVNGDGVIDGYDQRPIGYPRRSQPMFNLGWNNYFAWKNFDLTVNFSGGGMGSYELSAYNRYNFYRSGGLEVRAWENAWKREDPYDLNSAWIPGDLPPLRYNDTRHSSVSRRSTFWVVNVWYLRARTVSLGYTLPVALTTRLHIDNLRVYVNTYNLFSIDNLKKYELDPEQTRESSYQEYPQTRQINVGFDLTF